MAEFFGLSRQDVISGGTGEYWDGLLAVHAAQQQEFADAQAAREAAREGREAAEAPVLGVMGVAGQGVEFISTQL